MFENKDAKKERDNYEAEQEEKENELSREEKIQQYLQDRINLIHNMTRDTQTLVPGVKLLVEKYIDTIKSVSMDRDSAQIYFEKKEDVPCDIFCEIQKLGLFGTIEENNYTIPTLAGWQSMDMPYTDYRITITAK
ncbi:hypothetical protein [Nitrosopumilus sp.]|uniref:hypothetical protein n=1 Tax=Nitrosopumilus sp. TaxID=2024843 RepID=UPI003D1349E2